MMLKKPEVVKKAPKPIKQRREPKSESAIDYSAMAIPKPAVVNKIPGPIKSRRKSDKKRECLTGPFCFLCGNANIRILEKHECFFGHGDRELSIQYDMVVYLCGDSCHRLGPLSVHKNRESDLKVKRFAQAEFIKRYSFDLYMQVFGVNYL